MLILHEDIDVRLTYEESANLKECAESVATDVELITFIASDHTEGILSKTGCQRDELVGFFETALISDGPS